MRRPRRMENVVLVVQRAPRARVRVQAKCMQGGVLVSARFTYWRARVSQRARRLKWPTQRYGAAAGPCRVYRIVEVHAVVGAWT